MLSVHVNQIVSGRKGERIPYSELVVSSLPPGQREERMRRALNRVEYKYGGKVPRAYLSEMRDT